MCVCMYICMCIYLYVCVYIPYILFSLAVLNTRLRHFPNQPFTNGKHAVMYKSKEISETETVRQSLAIVLTTQSESRLFKHISRRLIFIFFNYLWSVFQISLLRGKNNREASRIINNDFFSGPTPSPSSSLIGQTPIYAIYRHLLSWKIISLKIHSFPEMRLSPDWSDNGSLIHAGEWKKCYC